MINIIKHFYSVSKSFRANAKYEGTTMMIMRCFIVTGFSKRGKSKIIFPGNWNLKSFLFTYLATYLFFVCKVNFSFNEKKREALLYIAVFDLKAIWNRGNFGAFVLEKSCFFIVLDLGHIVMYTMGCFITKKVNSIKNLKKAPFLKFAYRAYLGCGWYVTILRAREDQRNFETSTYH